MVFVQCVILVLAFPAFEEDVGDMGARLGINLTMLLTAMGFKSYLSDWRGFGNFKCPWILSSASNINK